MKWPVFIGLFLISKNLAGQISFKTDTLPLSQEYFFTQLDSSFQLSHNNDFEFRMRARSHLKSDWQCFILTQNNGEWSARMFSVIPKENYYAFKELTAKKKPVRIWKKLQKMGLLRLKGQAELQKLVEEDSTWNSFLDGKVYAFQFISRQGHREIYYCSPDMYAKHFVNITDFATADKLIMSVYKYFDWKY